VSTPAWDASADDLAASVRRLSASWPAGESSRAEALTALTNLGLFDLIPADDFAAARQRFAHVCAAGRPLLAMPGAAEFWTCGVAARLVLSIAAGDSRYPASSRSWEGTGDPAMSLRLPAGAPPDAIAERGPGPAGTWTVTGCVPNVFCAPDAQHLLLEAKVDDNRGPALLLAHLDSRVEAGPPDRTWAGDPLREFRLDRTAATLVASGSPADLSALTTAGLVTAATLQNGQLIGLVRRAMAHTIQHLRDRHQFGRRLADLPVVQAHLADAELHLTVAEVVAGSALSAVLREPGPPRGASLALAVLARLSVQTRTTQAITIANRLTGGIGYHDGYPLARLTRALAGQSRLFGARAAFQSLAEHLTTDHRVVRALGALQNPNHLKPDRQES
jgi:alkylation response protein AidB-like acyl-CoA dehydrogenase